jgi:hypothetical protein
MKFKTKVLQAGKTATGIEIPAKIVESFGAGKKPPITVTINGYTYRNTVAVYGGVYMVGISAEHRKGAGVKGGDHIEVNIGLDTKPREAEVPADFQKAMNKNAAARKKFDALSYSKKNGLILPVTGAKTEETRLRRIEKAIEALKLGKV